MYLCQVTFLGDGPLGQMTAIASRDGYVKGFVGNPLCDPPLKENGKVLLPNLSAPRQLSRAPCYIAVPLLRLSSIVGHYLSSLAREFLEIHIA